MKKELNNLQIERYGMAYHQFMSLDAKRDLLSKVCSTTAKQTDGTTPVYSQFLLPQIRTMGETLIDELLPRLIEAIAHEENPELFDPEKPTRSDVQKVVLYSELELLMQERGVGVRQAAHIVFPKWRSSYSSYKNIASRHHQVRTEIGNTQNEREHSRCSMLIDLASRYKDDKVAMSLWKDFRRYGAQLNQAHAVGDVASLLTAGNEIERIVTTDHPFVRGLLLVFAPTSVILKHSGSLITRLSAESQRSVIFPSQNQGETISEQEAIGSILEVLDQFSFTKKGRDIRKKNSVIKKKNQSR